MPAGTVLDHSGWRPTDADYAKARDLGVTGFVRYPYIDSSTLWKACTQPEYDKILSFGFQIAFTPELAAGTWRGGHGAGLDVGRKARNYVRGLGFPDDRPMHYAVDTNVAPGELSVALDYLQGCADGDEGPTCSSYGETMVIDGAYERGITQNAWRTAATSWDPSPSKHASMQQTTQHSYPQFPPDAQGRWPYDENIILKSDWGQHPKPLGDDMALPFQLWNDAGTVWRVDAAWQSKIRVPDLAAIGWCFDLLKEAGAVAPDPRIRDVTTAAQRAMLQAVPDAAHLILVPPTLTAANAARDAALAAKAAVEALPPGGVTPVQIAAIAQAVAAVIPPSATVSDITTAVLNAMSARLSS